ncbi:MAG: succinate dehydrogenase, hydrophobic membrane anchor protein [Beijerinckiaceae bacterium]|nr:succinate dehydrogenase, hydrophobic membrane anchor protein [Beijerinckiaceae bacterium]
MATNPSGSIRTPVAKVRHLGSARSGTQHAWRMRVTSLALLPLSIAFIWIVLGLIGKDHATVREALGHPFAAIVMLLFVPTGVYHMMLGMQTIIEDYVHGEHVKMWSLMANMFFCAVVGLACIYAVLRLSFI